MDERGVEARDAAAGPDGPAAPGDDRERPTASEDARDPLDEAPATSPRGATALTALGFVLGVLAFLPTGLTFVLGPVGMGCGLVANLKGQRAGFAAAVVAGVGTVVGLSARALLDLY